MNEPQANAAPVTPTVAVTAPAAAPVASTPIQDGNKTGSEKADLSKVSLQDMDFITAEIRNIHPPIPVAPAQTLSAPISAEKAAELDKIPAREVPADQKPTKPEDFSQPDPIKEAATETQTETAPVAETNPDETVPQDPTTPEPAPVPEEIQAKNPQQRIRAVTPEDDMALSIYNSAIRNKAPISMFDATIKAREILGASAKAIPLAKDTLGNEMPNTVEATDAAINKLRQERLEAKTALDTDKEGKLEIQIEDLRDHKLALKTQFEREQQAAFAQAVQAEEASKARAVAIYPDSGVKNSPLTLKIVEIYEDMRAQGNDLIKTPNWPLKIAQMAANDLGIAPGVKSKAAAAPSKPVASRPTSPAKLAAPIANGAARTTSVNTGSTAKALLDQMKTPQELDNVIMALAGHVR